MTIKAAWSSFVAFMERVNSVLWLTLITLMLVIVLAVRSVLSYLTSISFLMEVWMSVVRLIFSEKE